MAAAKTTHFIPVDASGRYRSRAICGTYVNRADHSPQPTCPECERRQADYESWDIGADEDAPTREMRS